MDQNLQNKIAQLKKLKQYKDYTDTQLIDAANRSLKEKKINEQNNFILEGLPVDNPKDKKILKQILNDYLSGSYIESKRQLFELKNLVYIIYKQRTSREKIEKQEKEKPNSVPKYAYDAYHALIQEGQKLSERIFGSNLKDDVSVLKQLFSRFKLWLNDNQGTRTIKCCYCGQMLMLKIRTDQYDVQKHAFFKDRLLTNEFLIKKYIEHKPVVVTEDFIAKVLGCSPLYVNWYLERHLVKANPLFERYLERKEQNDSKK